MEKMLLLLILYFVGSTRISGMTTVLTTTFRQDSSCGSWNPYTEEKCLRVADTTALLSKQEADALCTTLAETEALDDIPRLVTIKNVREQEALKKFLFEKLDLIDHVWLDADMGADGIFRWNNESELYFNNLVEQNITSTDRQCVQLESGQGIYITGMWSRVNCRKRNVVVCEKTQVWPVAQLQNSFLNFKTKVERQTEKLRLVLENEVEAQAKISEVEDSSLDPTPCGNWMPYKDEKCVKLIVKSGTQMKEEADVVCQGLKEFSDTESIPHLVTVKTEEKQKFLQDLLFKNQTTFDHVWLGLELVNDTLIRWNDGTESFFSNWAKQGNVDEGRNCVQMESGEGVYESGQWVRTNCRKRNAVVCEKTQKWTVRRLQNILLSLKLDVERNRKELEETLFATKQEAEQMLKQIKQEAEAKMIANRQEVDQTIKTVKQEAEIIINSVKQEAEQKINATNHEAERKNSENNAELERTLTALKQETDGKIKASEARNALVEKEADRKINANKVEFERTLTAFKQEIDGKIKAAEAKIASAEEEADRKISANKAESERMLTALKQETDERIKAAEAKMASVEKEADRKINANKAESERTLTAFKQEIDGKINAVEVSNASAKQEAELKINILAENQENQTKSCPNNFIPINHHCYYFSIGNIQNKWEESRRKCIDLKSSLLIIESAKEWNGIKNYINKEKMEMEFWWIGATNEPDQSWIWVGTSSPFEFTDWCTGEPNNHKGKEHCAYISGIGNSASRLCWNDYRCEPDRFHSHIRYICKL